MESIEILEQNAIDAAINFYWEDAINLNLKILKKNKKNLSAILRLAFAYLQLAKLFQAKKYYQKALKLQPTNTVVKNNLEKIKVLQTRGVKKNKKNNIIFNLDLFLEIPGKTKSVTLVNIGQKNILAQLSVGQEVLLKPKKRRVEIRTKDDEYIGRLPDDLSKRLMFFIKAKSVYFVYIKETSLNHVVIFIKEESKGKKIAHHLSFPVNSQAGVKNMESDSEDSVTNQEDPEEDLTTELDVEKLAENLTNEDRELVNYEAEEDTETEE